MEAFLRSPFWVGPAPQYSSSLFTFLHTTCRPNIFYILAYQLSPPPPPHDRTKTPFEQGFSVIVFISASPGLAVVFGTACTLHKLLLNEQVIGLFWICYLLQLKMGRDYQTETRRGEGKRSNGRRSSLHSSSGRHFIGSTCSKTSAGERASYLSSLSVQTCV